MRCGAIPKKLRTTTISSNAFCEIGDKHKDRHRPNARQARPGDQKSRLGKLVVVVASSVGGSFMELACWRAPSAPGNSRSDVHTFSWKH